MRTRWEYKVIGLDTILASEDDTKLQTLLNKHGEDGWELVNILDQVNSGFGFQPRVDCNLLLFKREKE